MSLVVKHFHAIPNKRVVNARFFKRRYLVRINEFCGELLVGIYS